MLVRQIMSSIQPQNPDSKTWMIVYTTHNPEEAHIVAGRLKHEGIMAMVDHAIGARSIGITIGSMGEVRVLVHPKDYDTAMTVLDPDNPGFDELPDTTDRIIYHIDEDDEFFDGYDGEDE